jgi:hypothetical protein
VGNDYVPLDEAVRLSGLHKDSLERLLRRGVIDGFKATYNGRRRWLVSVRSLRQYTDPFNGFLLELPGPKLFLRRLDETDAEETDSVEKS